MKKDLLSVLMIGMICFGLFSAPVLAAEQQPNFVVIFADDLGYGDLGCYGHPTLKTPGLDKMADEGMRFTQFYSAACVCTPSRAALLTGRLPIRSGMCSDIVRVLIPKSLVGLPASEITIAEALKNKGYATICIGKWHLGHRPDYLPMKNGFDSYFGIPYSNDMRPVWLMENDKVIEDPANQGTLTRRYTERVVKFIKANRDKPFFVYMPHTFPHTPLVASKRFKDTSLRGLYGDIVEELDWSVGQILKTLRELNLAENTLVFFTSDNGPWLLRKLRGGSAGLLRMGKGSTWEGGMREPALAWWPGKVKPGVVNRELACTMDIYTTCLTLAGVELPKDRVVDGLNLTPVLLNSGKSPRDKMIFYRGATLMAIRKGPWKAHLFTQDGYGPGSKTPVKHDPPLLYHLEHDPSEKYDVAKDHPGVVADLLAEIKRHRATVKPVKSQLEILVDKDGKPIKLL